MRRIFLVLVLMSLPLLPRASAQRSAAPENEFSGPPVRNGVQQVDLGHSVLALMGPWKFRIGDSPQVNGVNGPLWAQPGYDDSGWHNFRLKGQGWSSRSFLMAPVNLDPGWAGHGHRGIWGFGWYRIRIDLRSSPDPVSVLMPLVDSAYTVYWDGRRIGGEGKPDRRLSYVPDTVSEQRLLHVPAELAMQGAHVLALRVWDRPLRAVENLPVGGGLRGAPLLATNSAAERLIVADRQVSLLHMLEAGVSEIVPYFLVGLFSFVLFLYRPRQREYLWMALALFFFILSDVVFFSHLLFRWRLTNGHYAIADVVTQLYVLSSMLAAQWLLGLENQRSLRNAVLIAGGLYFLANVAVAFNGYVTLSPTLDKTLSSVYASLLLPCLGVFLWMAVAGIRRSGRQAWLMLSPSIAVALLFLWLSVSSQFLSADVQFVGYLLFEILVPLSVLLILAYRFLGQWRAHQRLQTDFENARQVQQLLIPATAPNLASFAIESFYLPANEVGGDFFQVVPGADGSLLIVVGDVSGKGLKAAMTVSTIIGALRNEPSRQPAEILDHLNRVVHGQIKGFVTCCAILIADDGAMTIANAGHLSPYCNGEEMAVEGGLPLGIVGDGSYEEAQFQLTPGDRLTFVSDGVVEATNAKRELFGFERTQAISCQPAADIAETARRFGQEDDITVLSVGFVGVPKDVALA